MANFNRIKRSIDLMVYRGNYQNSIQDIIRVCLSAILCTGYRHVKYLLHVFCGNEMTACLRRNLEQQRNMHRKPLRRLQLTCFDTIQTCYFCKHLYILSQPQILATSQF